MIDFDDNNDTAANAIDGMPSISMESLFYLPDWQVYYKDLKGRYMNCNEAACEFLQTPKEELLNKSDLDFPWRDSSGEWRENELKVIANNKLFQLKEHIAIRN